MVDIYIGSGTIAIILCIFQMVVLATAIEIGSPATNRGTSFQNITLINYNGAATGTGTHIIEQLVKWASGTLGVLTTDAGAEDIVSLTYKTADKQWYAQVAKDFQ